MSYINSVARSLIWCIVVFNNKCVCVWGGDYSKIISEIYKLLVFSGRLYHLDVRRSSKFLQYDF